MPTGAAADLPQELLGPQSKTPPSFLLALLQQVKG
jgi:hypothetical protein